MASFTVLGAAGFIGSNLVRWLLSQGYSCWAPGRSEGVLGRPLGHVIYCIGLTADFRQRPYDTARAHVCHLLDILEKADFTSLLYLSTTRIYADGKATSEDGALSVNPLHPDELYNISKIMGESLCLSSGRPNVRIARLSNVYGGDFSSDSFLSYVIREAVETRKVILRSAMESEKDYVHIDDVVHLLTKISLTGRHRLYNVASGVNTTNKALMEVIQRVTRCAVEVTEGATAAAFPVTSIDRIRSEFGFAPSHILDFLGAIIAEYRRKAETR